MSYRRFFDLLPKSINNIALRKIYGVFEQRLMKINSAHPLIGLDVIDDVVTVCNFQVSYENADTELAYLERSIKALCEKNADIVRTDLTFTPHEAAVIKFLETEKKCFATNQRFKNIHPEASSSGVASVLHTMQRKISEILGDTPDLSDLHLRFGPGANSNVRRKTSARYKLEADITFSRELSIAKTFVLSQYSTWAHSDCVSACGELSTVPKNAEIDRCIIIEPLLNTALQLPVGTIIKDRLRMFGCNLYSQERNRNLARKASIHDHLVTIDMSSASDLISVLVVSNLLPLSWLELLSTLRTGTINYSHKGITYTKELEKFSSMGNGFTFELESLIFYAACLAVYEEAGITPTDCSVYGDDIIIDSSIATRLVFLLEFLGFSVNTKKSCFIGNFRESCGGDYLKGTDIRPFYVKDRLTSARLVALINHQTVKFDPEIGLEIKDAIIHLIPKKHQLYGPCGYGDGHFVLLNDSHLRPHKRKFGYGGYSFLTYSKKPHRDYEPLQKGDALYPFYHVYAKESSKDFKANLFKKSSLSREADPYTIRGGYKETKVKVYLLSSATSYFQYDSILKSVRRYRRKRSKKVDS